jgi:hypothetical protein
MLVGRTYGRTAVGSKVGRHEGACHDRLQPRGRRSRAQVISSPGVVRLLICRVQRGQLAIVGVSLRLSSSLYSVSPMKTAPDDQVPSRCATRALRTRSGLLPQPLARQVVAVRGKGSVVAFAERWVA